MTTSNIDKLNQFYDQFTGADHVLIVINADPDAIASAMAVNRLLWRRVTNITISNINTITRPDNMAMIRLLDVTLIHLSKIDFYYYNKFVIVDSQPGHNESFSDISFTAVIDHHEDSGWNVPYKDIRPEYGATATILTEYLRAAKVKLSQPLATGLFHAIKTDTGNFERNATNADIRAFQYLFSHANIHMARRMEQVDLRIDFLEYFSKALNSYVLDQNRIFAHLGEIKNPDVCVLIADFFMRVNMVTWSLVSGIFENRLIIVIRNDGLRKDAGNVASQLFGEFGPAGGHKSMARAEIPLENLKQQFETASDPAEVNWMIQRFSEIG
ncbi:MAG TPA: DHH family phosphoesterase [Desulfosalsimonadaceae bacterium]|nr:DHH family phosphoesterase [Desulfosalsimonadaceae bacterium]